MKGPGGTCTSVQPYITGSRAVFSKILTKSHNILQVYETEVPPCLSRTVKRGSNIIENRESRNIETRELRIKSRESRIEDRGSRIENREAGSEDRGSWIEDRELRMENGELRIENRESRSEDRGSRIENGACQAGSGELMRMADVQVQNRVEFKYFLLLPNDSAPFLRKLNATNFKASRKEIRSRAVLFLKHRNFVSLQ